MKYTQISIRLAQEGDKEKWDAYATSHPGASPYHLFAWKEAVEGSYGHKGYYLLAEKAGQVAGILPLIKLRLPFLVSELTALPYCDVGNVLCDSDAVLRALLNESLGLCERLKAQKVLLRGDMNLGAGLNDRFHAEPTNKVRLFLELPDSSETLLHSFKSKLRNQIGRAERNGIKFSWGGEDEVADFYSVFAENMRDLGSPVHSMQWFVSILAKFGSHAKLGLVNYEGRAVGGCIVLGAGKTLAIPWASTLRRYNRLSPNMLLYWNVLKYAADTGFARFDFGRSTEGEGTYKFKRQWGAEPVPLNWYRNISGAVKTAEKEGGTKMSKREKLEEIWRRIPVPLANFVGPRIRKYISL